MSRGVSVAEKKAWLLWPVSPERVTPNAPPSSSQVCLLLATNNCFPFWNPGPHSFKTRFLHLRQSGCLPTGKDKKEKSIHSLDTNMCPVLQREQVLYPVISSPWILRVGDHHFHFIDGETGILAKGINCLQSSENQVSRLVCRTSNQTWRLFRWPGLALGPPAQFLYLACPQVCCKLHHHLRSRIKSSIWSDTKRLKCQHK